MLRPLLLVALLLGAAASAGCTDKLSFGAATLDEASFSVAPESGDAKTVFRVDAGKLGDAFNLTWDFGDGTLAYGPSAEHAYGFTNGVMTITLIATDESGAQGFATRTVTLGTGVNKDPTAGIRAARTWVEVGRTVNLTATGSDPDKDPLRYRWTTTALAADGGNGTGEERLLDGDAARVGVAFDAPGKYRVRVRAEDPKGGVATAETVVDVSTTIPSSVFQASYDGKITAGTVAVHASEKLWAAPADDTNVDAARHAFRLDYPGFALVMLTWNDTSGQGAVDLDLELRNAATGATLFKQETRAPAPAFEYNTTEIEAGDYEVVVRGITGADVPYAVLVSASLKVTPELVAAKES